MYYKNFEELIKKLQSNSIKKRVAVVAAQDEHTLEAVFKAYKNNIVEPVLIGDRRKITEIMDKLNVSLSSDSIVDAENDIEAARKAVEIVNKNGADFIMKGKIQSADLLKAVVSRESGLRTENTITHVAVLEVPSYHKLVAVTDGGMIMRPQLQEKKQIIENAVNVFLSFGYECPKVAVLTAVETVNLKMQETVDAAELKKMNQSKELKNCIVEGPISYDLTMSVESAKIKGYSSPVTGDVDILVSHDMTAGNILSKSLINSAGAKMAGIIVGAKVPVVLTSRGASSEEKYLSLVLSASAAK